MEAKTWNDQPFVCDECKGEPDYLYFDTKERKLLSVICQKCRDVYDAMIRSMQEDMQRICGLKDGD